MAKGVQPAHFFTQSSRAVAVLIMMKIGMILMVMVKVVNYFGGSDQK